jgi:hypothetical protein
MEGLDSGLHERALPSLTETRGRQDGELVAPIRAAEPADDVSPVESRSREQEGKGNKRSEHRRPWAEGWLTKCHPRGRARM